MNSANRERVKELLARAARLPPPDRADFIRRAAGDDDRTAAEAIDLLATLDDSAFLSAPTGAGLAAALPNVGIPGEGPGTRIDRYKLLQLIGEGGFGSVYMAEQTQPVHRRVALKIIKAGMDTRQVIARFEAERQALAMMDHPNIARVLDAGATDQGRPYFVMELVKGEPVTAYCDKERLALRQRLELFRDICNAVQHAHQKGIIHRDLKPTNVLVTVADGAPLPKVIDFGIAKATAARLTDKTLFTEMHQLIGTPEYMSPEQAEVAGVDIDTRSDVYSLGVLLYELLTGGTPLERGRLRSTPLAEVQRLIREEEAPRPSLRLATLASSGAQLWTPMESEGKPSGSSVMDIARQRRLDPSQLTRALRGDLDWIVMKCLEKDRRRRYATASALAEDVGRYLADQAVLATPPSRAYAARKFMRRNIGVVAAGAAIAATLVIAAGISISFAISATRQRQAAESARTRAETAEVDAKARAADLEQVAKFQQAQLAGIDVRTMGVRLRADLLEKARAAAERAKLSSEDVEARTAELEKLIAGTDFTGVALESLEENFFEPALAAIDEQFEDQPLVQAQLLQTLASTLHELGLFQAASEPQEEALAIREELLGNEDPDTLTSMNAQGALWRAQGKLPDAEAIYAEVLESRRRVLGEEHPDTLDSINNMARLFLDQGKLDEAESYYRDALEKRRRVLGDDHPDTLVSIGKTGAVLRTRGKLAEAEEHCLEALERSRRVLGEEHPNAIIACGAMASLLRAQGKLAESDAYCRDALEKSRRVRGEQHPDTITLIGNLCGLCIAQGKFSEAEPYCLEALDVRRLVLGNAHINTINSMTNVGALLQLQGRPAEAEPYFHEALEIGRKILGERHADVITAINNMGVILRGQGRLSEAEPYLVEALEKSRTVLGNDHPDTLNSIMNLGALLREMGRLAEAEPFCREALEKHREVLGAEKRDTIMATTNMGALLYAQGQALEAVDLLAPMEAAARRALTGGNAWQIGRFLSVLGCARAALGEFESAEAVLAEAHAALRDAPAATARDHSDVLTCLVELYDAWHAFEPNAGHEAEAIEWRTELDQLASATERSP